MKQIISVSAFFISWRRRYNWHKRSGTPETNNKQYFPLELQV